MKPLRVAQVTLSMGQGGIENLIISLARAVSRDQLHFHLYCLDAGGDLLATTEQLGIPFKVFGRRPGLDWNLIAVLARAFREDGIQLVHTHNQAAHFYGCLAARLARIPAVINTEHSRHYIQMHWRRRLEKRILSIVTDKAVTVSEELRQLSIENDRISPRKLEVIVNGVDVARFDDVPTKEVDDFRLQLGIPAAAPVLCIVARLHPIKNHPLLLQAVTALKNDYPDIRLLVVGDGEERAVLEQLSSELGLGGMVIFLGNCSDIPVILKASDALVLCSISEGLPLVLLEGMAARIPVVVTTGANRAGLIKHGVNGIVAGATLEELAAAIASALAAKGSSSAMTDAAYNILIDRYSIKKTADSYLRLYGRCQSRQGRPL